MRRASGRVHVGYVDGGDWLGFAALDVAGRTGFSARVASGGPGGSYRYIIPRDADRYYGVTARVNF